MARKFHLGNVRPHTAAVAEEILAEWRIYYLWGNGSDGHHAAGRAIDFMTLTDDQRRLRDNVGHEIAEYLQENAERLGVLYIIWKQRIWNDSRSDDRSRTRWALWRHMEDRGSPTKNHMDHVHVSFDNNPKPYRPPEDDMSAEEVWDHTFPYHGWDVQASTYVARAAQRATSADKKLDLVLQLIDQNAQLLQIMKEKGQVVVDQKMLDEWQEQFRTLVNSVKFVMEMEETDGDTTTSRTSS